MNFTLIKSFVFIIEPVPALIGLYFPFYTANSWLIVPMEFNQMLLSLKVHISHSFLLLPFCKRSSGIFFNKKVNNVNLPFLAISCYCLNIGHAGVRR